jgi:MFS family permease
VGNTIKEPIWKKDFILLLIGNFMNAISFYLLMTSIAVFTESTFHTSHRLAGFTVSVFLIGALVCRAFIGRYMDRIGRKKLLLIGSIANTIICFAYYLASGVAILIIIRVVHGFTFAINSTLFLTCGVSEVPESRKGEGNGYFTLGVAGGTAIGPFLALYLIENYTYNLLFAVCSVASVLAVLLIIPAQIEELPRDLVEKVAKELKGFTLWNYIEKGAVKVSVTMFFVAIAYSCIISFTNAYAIAEGLTKAASFFFLIYAIFLFISRPTAGMLYDKLGENIVALPSYILFAAAMVMLSLSGYMHSGAMFIASAVVLAFGYGIILSTFQAVVMRDSPPERVGMAISTYFIALDSGNGVGGYVIGALVDGVGFRKMFLVVAAMLIAIIPLYWQLHGKNHRRNSVK